MNDLNPWDSTKSKPLPLPRSLWAEIADPAPETMHATTDEAVDVAVIGAGYTGLTAAIYLAAKGVRVAVLEAAEAGWGASGRNGGQVIPGLKIDPDEVEALLGGEKGRRLVAWAGNAPDLVFNLIKAHDIACSPVRNGWIQPAYTRASLKIIESRCAQWAARGAPVKMLERANLPDLLGTPRYIGAWLDTRGGSINPLGYSRGLAKAAIAAGAALYTSTPVTRLVRKGTTWDLRTPHATMTAHHVIVATGAYATDLLPELRRTIIPVRIGEVATKPLSETIARTILPGRQVASDWRRLLTSFRITPDGRLMMGGSTATADLESAKIQDSLHRSARDLFGHLGDFQWEFFWSGVFAVTGDKLPHFHEPEPNVLTVVGCNGRGIAVSTGLGKLLAERVMGCPADDLPLPLTKMSPMYFHGLHRPVMRTLVGWKGVQDRFDKLFR